MSVIPDHGYVLQCALNARRIFESLTDVVAADKRHEVTAKDAYDAFEGADTIRRALGEQLAIVRREVIQLDRTATR